MGDYGSKLTKEERLRNSQGNYILFFRSDKFPKIPLTHSFINCESVGLEGELKPLESTAVKVGYVVVNPLGFGWEEIADNQVACCVFVQPASREHLVQLKKGIKLDEYEVTEEYVVRTDTKSFNGQRMLGIVSNRSVI